MHWTTALLGVLLGAGTKTEALSRLYGVNYSAKKGPDWETFENRCKDSDEVKADLQLIKNEVTDNVRLFSMTDCYPASKALFVAPEIGIKVWLGIWVGPFQTMFNDERQQLLDMLNEPGAYDFNHVLGVHVSSEAIYRGDITVTQAIDLRNVIRADLDAAGWSTIPVTVADVIDTNVAHPELITLDRNVTTFNYFPFWEKNANNNIIPNIRTINQRAAFIEEQSGERQIIVTETGWADAGSNDNANKANPENMVTWMKIFHCVAALNGWQYFWFDAFDSDWRRIQENNTNDVEGHFGILHANGTMKSFLQDLNIWCSDNDFNDVPIDDDGYETDPAPTTTTPRAGRPTTSPMTQVIPAATPTKSPVTAPIPQKPTVTTASPFLRDEETLGPTKAPAQVQPSLPQAPLTKAPIAPANTPPFMAPTKAPARVRVDNSQCRENAACAARGLTGQCCPTMDDWTLTCCGDGSVQELCQGNSKCAALELTGACCPTIDKKYLDCCDVVPDECSDSNSTACQRYSAVEYKLELEQAKASGALSHEMGWTAVTLLSAAALVLTV